MPIKCRCASCNRSTNHNVLKEVKQPIDDGEGWWEESTYQIIQCAGCEEITFRKLYTDSQMQQYYDPEFDDVPYSQELFPKRDRNTRNIKVTRNLPKNLTTIYRETIDAFNNGQYILCSAGLRTLIEGICLDKEITGKEVVTTRGKTKISTSLESKIDGLSINRFLTEENSKALHELRFLGNDSLHELNLPDVDDLITAIDIIELTLSNIYELSHKTRKLRSSAEFKKMLL